MVPDGISYSSLPLSFQFCLSSLCHIFLLFFLFHFSVTYLLLLVVPGVSECLGSYQEWPQECYAPPVPYGARQGSSWVGPAPTRLLVH